VDALFLGKMEGLMRSRISELRDTAVATSESRETVELDQQSIGRLSRMDALQQQAMANANQAMRAQEIVALQAALKRLQNDDYGYCMDCGEDIDPARLALAPTARKCLDCARG